MLQRPSLGASHTSLYPNPYWTGPRGGPKPMSVPHHLLKISLSPPPSSLCS